MATDNDATGWEIEELRDGWMLFTFQRDGKTFSYQIVKGTLEGFLEMADSIRKNLKVIRKAPQRTKETAELQPDFSGPVTLTIVDPTKKRDLM
jgi:hypothetical protein